MELIQGWGEVSEGSEWSRRLVCYAAVWPEVIVLTSVGVKGAFGVREIDKVVLR